MKRLKYVLLLIIILVVSCSKSPSDKAKEDIESFLNLNITDYPDIEILEIRGPDSLGVNFETWLRLEELSDSGEIIIKKGEVYKSMIEGNKLLGGSSDYERSQLFALGTMLKSIASRKKLIIDTANWKTDHFTFYYSFRHKVEAEPTIERFTFFCDGSGKILGFQDLGPDGGPILRLNKTTE